MEPSTVQPPAGGVAENVALEPAPAKPGGRAELFTRRKQPTRTVDLPGKGPFLMSALTPLEIGEVNARTVDYTPDPESPNEVKPVIDPMRNFYLIARGLRETDGARMFKSIEGVDNAWIAGGHKVATELNQEEVDLLLEAVNDLSGLTRKARERAEKNSGKTGIASASSTSR